VWDLFFLKGIKVIFRVSLALLSKMKNQLMQLTDFGKNMIQINLGEIF